MEWLDNDLTFSVSGVYCNWVIYQLIKMRQKPNEILLGCEGGYILTRAVPPELILEFIDMTNFIDDEL